MFMVSGAFAFASNPFMDVPMNHWSYDAVSQLAANGVVVGYPDGLYRGNQPTTRYEMATVIARTLALVDLNKVSVSDFEILKKLVVEYKDELDALGVRVDQLDYRLKVVEERLGGWKINGQMTVRYDSIGEDNSPYNVSNRNSVYFNDGNGSGASLYFKKYIDDKTTFNSELAVSGSDSNLSEVYWRQFYVDVNLPWDITMRVGRFNHNWYEYYDYRPWFGMVQKDGVIFSKTSGYYSFGAYFSNESASDTMNQDVMQNVSSDVMTYGIQFNWTPMDWILFGMNYDYWNYETVSINGTDDDISVLGAELVLTPWNGIKVGGEYWKQDNETFWQINNIKDPSAWKVYGFVDQNVLKYTSVYVEYSSFGQGFWLQNDPFAPFGADVLFAMNNVNNSLCYDTTSFYTKLNQQWNEKFNSYVRYVKIDNDRSVDNLLDQSVSNWSTGVWYHYTPSVAFGLEYDNVDYDNVLLNDDNMIRLQTNITF